MQGGAEGSSDQDLTPDIVVVVTGSRFFFDPGPVASVLSAYVGKRVVLYHGAARGVDTSAADFGRAQGWTVRPYPAKWQRYGNEAGGRRNVVMVRDAFAEARWACPIVCHAFPGPDSSGTYGCAESAKEVGITDVQFHPVSR